MRDERAPRAGILGELLADLIVDRRIACVLDMSHMSKTKARSFTTAFAERLYFRNRESLMVVVDEADVLIPQRASAETARLLGAMEDIAKRGRGRGLGLTVITQRPQEVAKSVLDLCETLILLGMTGPRSLKAVRDWIDVNVDDDISTNDVISTLPSLRVGEAWVWSPAFLRTLVRTKIRLCSTFDSHKTPEPGARAVEPRMASEVDLEALGEEIAATIEKAKANDPRELQRRLESKTKELEGAIRAIDMLEREKAEHVCEMLEQEVPLLTMDEERMLRDIYKVLDERLPKPVADRSQELLAARNRSAVAAGLPVLESVPKLERKQSEPKYAPTPPAPARKAVAGSGDAKLGKAERAILTVLAQHPDGRTRRQLTSLTGYTYSGGFRNSLASLRTSGYIVGGNNDTMRATTEGLDALGDYETLPTGPALLDHWMQRLSKAEGLALRALIDAYPVHQNGHQLAAVCGYEYSGGFRNALSRLRTLEMIDGSNTGGMAVDNDFAEAIGLT